MGKIKKTLQEYHRFLKMRLSLDISDVWVNDYLEEVEFTQDDKDELYKLETFNSIDGLSEKGVLELNNLRSKKALSEMDDK